MRSFWRYYPTRKQLTWSFQILFQNCARSSPFPRGTRDIAHRCFTRLLTCFDSTLRTALLLPSITRRIDDLLLVKELNAKFFEHSIIEHHLHAAVSAPAAGNEFDYERLELLGKRLYYLHLLKIVQLE